MTPLPPTRFVSVNGIRLAYAEWPSRPGAMPVVCLPHLTGHKGVFAALAQCLAPDFRLLALDLRGRGESDQPADGYGFAYHARDLLAFAEALSLPPFVLLGHSFGASTAVYFGAVQPRRVRALVLLDGGTEPKMENLRAMLPTVQRLDQSYASLDAFLSAMQSIRYYQPWNAALDQYFRDDVMVLPDGSVQQRSSAAAIMRDLDLHVYYLLRQHLPALRCPVLFLRPAQGLAGDRGHVFSEAEAQMIAASIPNCLRIDIPGVNHYSMLVQDDPPVVPRIREFLDSL